MSQIFENGSDEEEELRLLDIQLKNEQTSNVIEHDEPSQLPKKKPRKKRILTEAQKEVLRNNLKRGRITSAENRRKKKKLKEIAKLEKYEAEDIKIAAHIEKKKSHLDLKEEIRLLKEQINNKKPEPFKEPEPKKTKEPAAAVTFKEPMPIIKEEPKKGRRACGIRGLSLLRSLNQF